jgi:formylmethanofuran dehydrogenase subunit D
VEYLAKSKVTLITGRSLAQGLGTELGKSTPKYRLNVAICEMSEETMSSLGLKHGYNVKISTQHGSVVVTAVKSSEDLPLGMVFMPYSPWSNLLIDSKTGGTGMPTYKGLSAEIETEVKESPMELSTLLQTFYRR